jgi:hypothetical protein
MNVALGWCDMASRNGANVNLEINFTPLLKGVEQFDQRLERGIVGVFERQKQISAGWMRDNAPWTDRTGNARSGLSTATQFQRRKSYALILFGRMPYNIWLEVRFQGRYAVIIPGLVDQGPKLMKTLNKLFARIGG